MLGDGTVLILWEKKCEKLEDILVEDEIKSEPINDNNEISCAIWGHLLGNLS